MKILITGANGFIGRGLSAYLAAQKIQVIPAVRKTCNVSNSIVLPNDDEEGWYQALLGCDAVVHLAGQAQSKNTDESSLLNLHKNNVDFAVLTLQRAIRAGVPRFIFLSTAKVHGEQTESGECFKPESDFNPLDAYAASKAEAEKKLQAIARGSEIELVIIRPPLVYGPGVKGNFGSMIKWVKNGVPLPLAGVNNLRSMIATENLFNFIALCTDRNLSSKAGNRAFLITDGKPLSTADVLRKIARSAKMKSRIFYIPIWVIKLGFKLIGKSSISDRLLGSFVLDDSSCRKLLDWTPVLTMEEQLQRMNFDKNF